MRFATLVLVAGLGGSPALSGPVATLRIVAGADALEAASDQILSVALRHDMGGPVVVVTLEPGLADALATLTGAHVGEEVAILVCGREVNHPHLWAPIPDGVFAISGSDLPTARHLAAVLRAKDCQDAPAS